MEMGLKKLDNGFLKPPQAAWLEPSKYLPGLKARRGGAVG